MHRRPRLQGAPVPAARARGSPASAPGARSFGRLRRGPARFRRRRAAPAAAPPDRVPAPPVPVDSRPGAGLLLPQRRRPLRPQSSAPPAAKRLRQAGPGAALRPTTAAAVSPDVQVFGAQRGRLLRGGRPCPSCVSGRLGAAADWACGRRRLPAAIIPACTAAAAGAAAAMLR